MYKKENNIISEKNKNLENKISITRATYSDFNEIKKMVNELSDDNRRFFSAWLFDKKPRLKIRVGQFLAKISLMMLFGKILKKIIPYCYVFILVAKSPESGVVGYIANYLFKKRKDGTSEVTISSAVSSKFQNMGLGTRLRQKNEEELKKENVSLYRGGFYLENKKNYKIAKKLGYKITRIEKNKISKFDGKKYDFAHWEKQL